MTPTKIDLESIKQSTNDEFRRMMENELFGESNRTIRDVVLEAIAMNNGKPKPKSE